MKKKVIFLIIFISLILIPLNVFAAGWKKVDGYWYYYNDSGEAKTGWFQYNDNWYYFDADGKMVTGIKYVNEDSAYYYFSEKESTIGIMQTDWRRSGNDWYYLNDNGKAKVNDWLNDGGPWYYFKDDAKLAIGVTYVPSEDSYYFFSPSERTLGNMERSAWFEYNGYWYYANESGKLKRDEWYYSGDNSYYFDNTSKMVTGFKEISGNTYYFSKKSSNDNTLNNVEVHIKNQTDLNNYLSTTGQNILGDRVFFENTSNIQFPANAVYYLDITSSGLAGGDFSTYWYLTTKSTGNIDFNNSTFLIGEETALYMHGTGSHSNQVIKNGTFFGSVSAEYLSGGSLKSTRGNFNADLVHASDITFKNLTFNNVQEIEDHILDNVACDNITYDGITVRGFLSDYSSSELSNILDKYVYKEAIQIDVSNTNSAGMDLDKTVLFNNDMVDGVASSNITIKNSYFGPYNGPTGQNIIDKKNVNTVRPFGPTIGSHAPDANGNHSYSNITITNNTFANSFCRSGMSSLKYIYPVHLQMPTYGIDISNNTFINQCSQYTGYGNADSWNIRGYYGNNGSDGNVSATDDDINDTPLDASSIKSKVTTISYSYGSAQTGFIQDNSNTYYFRKTENEISTGPKATMVLGLVTINGNTYYFRNSKNEISTGPKGSAVKNTCTTIDNVNYCFDSNGIAVARVNIPTTSMCNSLTYTGSEQTLTKTAGEGYTWSNNKKTDAGSYQVTATLKDGYEWSDQTTSAKTITCSIAKLQLTKPTMSTTSYSYTGSIISPTISNVDTNRMTVSGTTSSIDSGNFTVTITLKDKTNTVWKDNTTTNITLNWKINKLPRTAPSVTSYNGVYDGYSHTITATGEGTLEYSQNGLEWTTTKPTRTNVGTTTVYVRVKEETNYQSSNEVQGTIEITKLQITKPTISETTFTYTGNEITPTISNVDTNRMTTSGTTSSTNAGDYTVTISLKDKINTIWKDNTTSDITLNWKINKATRPKPTVTSYSGIYDGSSHTITATGEGTLKYSTDNSTWSEEKPTRKKVGVTTVYVKVIGDSNHNDSQVVTGKITIKTDTDYEISEYDLDDENDYISNIPPNTELNDYMNNISLGEDYTVEIDYVEKNNKMYIYTGGKTKIKKNGTIYKEYTNIVLGDTNGDGDVGYIDYVKVYNHIQKEKHPESTKQLLTGAYLKAADMSKDNKITYLDYVKIYNKIKELKGGNN